jgi:hypothetical protein
MFEFEVIWVRGGTTISQTVFIDKEMLLEIALEGIDSALDDVNLDGYEIHVHQVV